MSTVGRRLGWASAAALVVGLQLGDRAGGAMSCQVAHPVLLFHDIAETPGYQHRTQDPWKGWEASLLSQADAVLKRDFTTPWTDGYNRVIYRSQFGRNVAIAYQITKDSKYSDQAKQALLHLDLGDTQSTTDWAMALGNYCMVYDWVQPTLDTATDSTVRDALAALADRVYKDLNHDEKGALNDSYVTFADYHGQAYPLVGVAGLALSDYTHTAGLSSTPADWLKVGTEYLFVDDKLHKHNRSLLSHGFDERSGKHLVGSYKAYVTSEFLLWFQVHHQVLKQNLLDLYPAAKRAFTSEVWESLPNHYHNNYVTSGNTGWRYHTQIVNLLDAENQSYVLNHDDKIEASKILPYSSTNDAPVDTDVSYCTTGDLSTIPRAYPPWTSHLQDKSVYQVFRGSWAEDSEWMSLVTFNATTYSNRDTAHHDQLSLEYYGKGDLLIADAGEVKHVLDGLAPVAPYSEPEVFQNAIAVEDPRTPFALAEWSHGPSRGFVKGSAAGLTMPVQFANLVQVPWMELLDTRTTPEAVIGATWDDAKQLSSPIHFDRAIAFPDKDYFAVIDRLYGTEPWIFRNVFRPASLSIVPSEDKNKDKTFDESEVGHVNGDLVLAGNAYDWLPLAYKTETSTGVNTSSLEWKTTNPYGKTVQLQMFSVPSSDVLITKHVGRIAGYDASSEVYSPVVYLKTAPTSSLYRVTVLLSRYAEEAKRTVESLPVTGTGNALRVSAAGKDDYWYTGSGSSSFGSLATDADTLHLRGSSTPTSFTWVHGTTASVSGFPLAVTSIAVDYLSWHRDATTLSCKVKTGAAVDLRLHGMDPSAHVAITMDGAAFSGFSTEAAGATLVVPVPSGEHLFEVTGSGWGPDAGPALIDAGGAAAGSPPSDSGDTGGCGCWIQSKGQLLGGLLALLGLAALATRRRQRPSCMGLSPRRGNRRHCG